jgi:hypothetical protein
MTVYDKCTCVKVNRDKMDLIKKKGLNLQDILDKAMDNELNLNKEMNEDTLIQISDKINELSIKKEERLIDYQKKTDLINRLLTESKENEMKYYDQRIEYLKNKKQYLEKTIKSEEYDG